MLNLSKLVQWKNQTHLHLGGVNFKQTFIFVLTIPLNLIIVCLVYSFVFTLCLGYCKGWLSYQNKVVWSFILSAQKQKLNSLVEAYQYHSLLHHAAYCTHSESCSPEAQVSVWVGSSCASFQSGYSSGQQACG